MMLENLILNKVLIIGNCLPEIDPQESSIRKCKLVKEVVERLSEWKRKTRGYDNSTLAVFQTPVRHIIMSPMFFSNYPVFLYYLARWPLNNTLHAPFI